MYAYDTKVRGSTYLWGSDGIASSLNWPLLLTVRVDVLGDPVQIQSELPNGQKTIIGTLQAGECYTMSLLGLRGVIATCDQDASVSCVILVPQLHAVP